jgi:hypothetical protein
LHCNSLQSTRVSSARRLRRKPDLVRLSRHLSVRFSISDGFPVRSRFHRATAPSLIRHFRDCVKGAPRELYANVLLTAGPADKDSLVVIQICYVGPKEGGLVYLQALSSWTGERCLLNEVHEKTFLSQQDSVAQVLRGKRGNQWFIRSALISSLPDEAISKTVLEFADTPVGCSESPYPPFVHPQKQGAEMCVMYVSVAL